MPLRFLDLSTGHQIFAKLADDSNVETRWPGRRSGNSGRQGHSFTLLPSQSAPASHWAKSGQAIEGAVLSVSPGFPKPTIRSQSRKAWPLRTKL